MPESRDPCPGTLLFICTGNTCRSPMAAAIARQRLDKRGHRAIMVESAGLAASGEPAADNAAAVLQEWGLDLHGHHSTPVSDEQLRRADVIAVMTPAHAARLTALGVPAGKVHILGAPAGIPDPYGGDIACYRRVRDALAAAIDRLADELAL